MSLFGSSGSTNATSSNVVNGVDVQTSLAGQSIQIVYGCNRVAGNLIWTGGFYSEQGSSSAGKGGNGATGQTSYYASFIIGICEGPVVGCGRVWASKTNSETLADANLTFSNGAVGQPPWGGLEYLDPSQALGYSGICWVAGYDYDLGSSASLPNFGFEIYGVLAGSNYPALFDANPAYVVQDFLTNPYYGAGFPIANLGDLTVYQQYCQAQSLWVSPIIDQSEDAASQLSDMVQATNCEFVWSGAQLTIVPYGDLSVSANGGTYVAPQNPLFDLTDDDFLYAAGEDPVTIDRARPADQVNALSLEYLNRNNAYNPDLVQARDEASIALYGLQTSTPGSAHYFCDPIAAQASAYLQLARKAVRNQYTFKLGWQYCVLDPMDIVSITDTALGLDRQWVRILTIDESDWSAGSGGDLTVTAEEYLTGTGQTALYSYEQGSGYQPNYNAAAPRSYAPIFLEPSFALTSGDLEVWMALAGPAGTWSGADIWISLDGTNYTKQATCTQSARYGYLYSPLAASSTGLDQTDSFGVDLTPSQGSLPVSPGLAAAEANTSLAWIDGEFLSFGAVELINSHQYQVSLLNRGQYGTPATAHAAETPFVRCDDALVVLPIQPGVVGETLYVKVLDRNAFGGGQPSLADVEAYAYTVKGTAYTEPLGAVENLATVFTGGIESLVWDVVTDYRAIVYEIRQGSSFGMAVPVGQTAETSFAVTGNGTYWVAARFTAPNGFVVYGAAADVIIDGGIIIRNLLDSFDEKATGWTGACSGTAIVSGNLQLASTGNVLTQTNFLAVADLLALGGIGRSGTYTVPSAHIINAGRVLNARIAMNWAASAVSIYDNVLTIASFLSVTDLLEVANGPFIAVQPQIRLAQADGIYGGWQNFAAGEYEAQYFDFQLALATSDVTINCVVSAFSVATDVPSRTDTGAGLAVPSTGATVTYTAPFNNTPSVQVTIINGAQGDDAIIAKTTAGFTVTIENGGTGVARTIDWVAQGF